MGGEDMILYHGSTIEIRHPRCDAGRKNLDFGQGFYLTFIREQAENWARRVSADRGMNAVVNEYEIDIEHVISNYQCLTFKEYNESWLEFIVSSRQGLKPWAGYDLIEGGVANDRVIDTINLYTLGIIDKQAALGNLAQHQPNNQICILNQNIIDKHLKFKGSIEL